METLTKKQLLDYMPRYKIEELKKKKILNTVSYNRYSKADLDKYLAEVEERKSIESPVWIASNGI